MAWKVYDAFASSSKFYGPHPCKRWVPVKGEKYKVRKHSAPSTKSPGSKRDITSAKSVEYARWLAARDSIPVRTDIKAMPVWADVLIDGKRELRVSAVMFANVRIDIPNWDWTPAPPVESVVDDETAFADLLPRGLAILAGLGLESEETELEAA